MRRVSCGRRKSEGPKAVNKRYWRGPVIALRWELRPRAHPTAIYGSLFSGSIRLPLRKRAKARRGRDRTIERGQLPTWTKEKGDVEEGGERGGGGVGGKGVSQADSKRRSPGAVWNLLKMIHSLR